MLTTFFTLFNILYIPVATLKHTVVLIQSLTSGNENMDEWSEIFLRMQTIMLFMMFGPLFLVLAIPVDSFVFFYNLYTFPISEDESAEDLISKEDLETFQMCCIETLKTEKVRLNKHELKSRVNYVQLNKNLQSKFRI